MTRRSRLKQGLFVTFEGIDGCGKSTQLANTRKFLTAGGYDVVTLREPGSTPVAERIRKVLLDKRLDIADITELLLYEAARHETTSREIAPSLQQRKIVPCDRFYDSTTAYQGYGRRLDLRMVQRLHRVAVGDCVPDLTLLFDVDLKTSMTRRKKDPDRLESQSAAFFRRVRRGFLEIARKEPRRVKVVDGTRPIDDVFEDVRKHLQRRLPRR